LSQDGGHYGLEPVGTRRPCVSEVLRPSLAVVLEDNNVSRRPGVVLDEKMIEVCWALTLNFDEQIVELSGESDLRLAVVEDYWMILRGDKTIVVKAGEYKKNCPEGLMDQCWNFCENGIGMVSNRMFCVDRDMHTLQRSANIETVVRRMDRARMESKGFRGALVNGQTEKMCQDRVEFGIALVGG